MVLALPRGAVPVGYEVARAIGADLDVFVVCKIGSPGQPELGMGAVGEDGVRVINDEVVRMARVTPEDLARVERREQAEVEARARRFRSGRMRVSLAGRTVILVDDGIATGSTMRAACQVARAAGARRVVVAVPVAPPDAVSSFSDVADEVVCLATPSPFYAVGQWYADFTQVSDAEVTRLLQREPVTQSSRAQPSRTGHAAAGLAHAARGDGPGQGLLTWNCLHNGDWRPGRGSAAS